MFAPGWHRDALGPCRGQLGRVVVAADPGDDRIDGVGCCDPLRLAELCREAPGFFCCGYRYAPVGELRCRTSLQREHARQMPEPSLRSQTLDCFAEEHRREIEGSHGHRCRSQETGGVRVVVNLLRGFPEALEYCWCLPERVGIGLDRKDPQVC